MEEKMLSAVGKDRLTRLVKLLRANADNTDGVKFDLTKWGYSPEGYQTGIAPLNCGTKACAFALAAISGEFCADGLEYKMRGSYIEVTYSPFGEQLEDDKAAAEFFNISPDAAWYLFIPSNYPDRDWQGATAERKVADRIEQFVQADGVIPEGALLEYPVLDDEDED
jgi:hypothetical protein